MADLKTTMGELELANPIIISPGHVTRRGEDIKRADGYGAGAINIKTGFLEKEYEQVVKPYQPGKFPDARAQFAQGGDGIINIVGLSPDPIEVWAKWIRENKKELKTPLIASEMATTIEGYVKAAKLFQESGVDALEILLACPLPYLHPFQYVGGASFDAKIVEEVCSAVRGAVDLPLGVKLMFNPLNMEPLRIPQKIGLDFFTLCLAVLAAPGIDLEKIKPIIPCSVFMSGSHGAKHTNFFALLQQADQIDKIDISATGGVQGWEDIVEYILYGASSVQIQTLFMVKGLGIIKGMKQKISEWMDAKEFSSIKEMRGAILPKLLTFDHCIAAYGSTKGKVLAVVDKDKCTGCGICLKVCIYNALEMVKDSVNIISENCEGCRICVCACPEGALSLTGDEAIYRAGRVQA